MPEIKRFSAAGMLSQLLSVTKILIIMKKTNSESYAQNTLRILRKTTRTISYNRSEWCKKEKKLTTNL
jgi:hypothetical protein